MPSSSLAHRGPGAGAAPEDPDTRSTAERLDAIERGQAEILAGQARILALLERGRGARPLSPRDLALLDAIAAHVEPETVFGAAELYRHAETVGGGLRAALAGIADANALGRRLTRIARHHAGLARVGRDEAGIVWCLTPGDVAASERQSSR